MITPEWSVTAGWVPLGQSWRGGLGTEPEFNPGRARIAVGPTALQFEVVMREANPRNRATRLNEETWKLGSVCEFFVQAWADRYIELHITPENQRLQLAWPLDGLLAVRAGSAKLETFMVTDECWCQSAVSVQRDQWSVKLELPFLALDIDARFFQEPGQRLSAAVCRYDCSRMSPILSSTAPLTEANFHRRWEWHRIGTGH